MHLQDSVDEMKKFNARRKLKVIWIQLHVFYITYITPCIVNPCLADTPLLRTGAKSPAETSKKCTYVEITRTTVESHYYGIADSGPKVTFLLFYSC